ncbi:HAD-IC family P-type ATPase [Streptomyces sp. GC420]|nr:HAD-IC family P-type ATPase [Streptomyces sp. GC420]
MTKDEVYAALGTSPRGLTAADAGERRLRYGPNELPQPRRHGVWRKFLAQFTDLFAVVLIVASVFTFSAWLLSDPRETGYLQLTIAILCVVLLNAVIGFVQEYSAERTAQTLQAMVPHTSRVLRDGARTEVPASELVPGDLVVLEAGDAVSADCRLVEAHALSVNNAPLTGESTAVGRNADPSTATVVLEARNHVFMGTTVVNGSGKAVVLGTGAATEFGRIFRLTEEAPQQRTPLQIQVASMARRVALLALAVGLLVMGLRLQSGEPFVPTVVFGLGVIVALVPEGLPATLSVSLAIGVRRMARRQALVKRLLAVEALGSTTVICTDKTGTLTQAEMTVTELWRATPGTGPEVSGVRAIDVPATAVPAIGVPASAVPETGAGHAVSGIGYGPEGEVTDPGPVREMLRCAALCSDARLLPPTGKLGRRVLGDTTEGAILVAAGKAGIDTEAEEKASPRVAEFPFDPVRKLMSTVHRTPDGLQICTKGAYQELLTRCTTLDRDGAAVPLTPELRAWVVSAGDAMAAQGLRVLGVARRACDEPPRAMEEAESGLVFLGLVGMLDPPRLEVSEAVRACRRAGIRIAMVTGDHPLTAEAIARRVGIVTHPSPTIVTGSALDAMDDARLDGLVATPGELLLCRVSPEHKMRIVAAFRRQGQVVAVTGDGANDAPALKHADIGIAMGEGGTDVAREASAMVLLDDSFASIAAAVELGRSVYRNIRRFLVYLFSSNVAELAPIVGAAFAGFPLVPISALQILAIDLGSDVLPSLALGAEPPEPDTMDRPPRSRRERLFSLSLVGRILFLGGVQSIGVCFLFFWTIHSSGIPLSDFTADEPAYQKAVTLTQATIVVSQFFNSLAVRTDRESVFKVGLFSNPRLLLAGLFGLALMAAISYAPPLQAVFNTAPLTALDWLVMASFGLLLLAAEETRKWVLRRSRPHAAAHDKEEAP